jgi:7-cyano-7-deazaguanine reductase
MITSSGAFFSNSVRQGDSMRVQPSFGAVNTAALQPVEGTHLGKKVEYKFDYDPTLLVPVPRQENRNLINVKNDNLPFIGNDVWNAYEVSALTTNGLPYCGVAKIVYPCNSEFLVESKSLKLYLNSFNMTKIQNDVHSTSRELEIRIGTDLSAVLKTNVKVKCFTIGEVGEDVVNTLDYVNLDNEVRVKYPDLACSIYNEDPNILVCHNNTMSENNFTKESRYVSHTLRSNCKITKQPDWGTVYIKYNSEQTIKIDSLFQYIVSFRNEAHFHEEICETIFKRLFDVLKPKDLLVACFYTRRGGIDINPIRATSWKYLKEFDPYMDERVRSFKHHRQ